MTKEKNILISEFQEAYQEWNEELQQEEESISTSNEIREENKLKAKIEAERRRANIIDSRRSMEGFLELYTEMIRNDFLPAVAIDDDGEISMEWYGRCGARAIVLFQANGGLYFIALFHGESVKYQLEFCNSIPKEIQTNLEKIYLDKINRQPTKTEIIDIV